MLTKASAYMSGSDYWVVPPLEDSYWTQTLNWYLNFQISKQRAHKNPDFPNTLKEILKENELPFTTIEAEKNQPLMIASQNRLPTQYVIEVPRTENTTEWFEQILEISNKIQSKKLRVFLPHSISESQVLDFWSTKDVEASFVTGEVN